MRARIAAGSFAMDTVVSVGGSKPLSMTSDCDADDTGDRIVESIEALERALACFQLEQHEPTIVLSNSHGAAERREKEELFALYFHNKALLQQLMKDNALLMQQLEAQRRKFTSDV